MPGRILILAALMASGTGMAYVSKVGRFRLERLDLAFGTLSALSAAPGTISFQANNPDAGQVTGSSTGSVTWSVVGGSHLQNWTLTVQSESASFSSCPTIPVSAIVVSCGSASASGSGEIGRAHV